jgi:hypothetical protein
MKSIVTHPYVDRYCAPAKSARPEMQFCRTAWRTTTSGATAGALGRSPGRRVRTALDIARHPAESVTVSSRFHCRSWPAAPFPSPRRGPGSPLFQELLCRSAPLSPSGRSRPGPSRPAARAGVTRCGLVFRLWHGSDVAGSNAAVAPRRPGERG